MSEAKVSWLLCIGKLVSKADNVMHFAHFVNQVSIDHVLWLRSCSLPTKTSKGFFIMPWNFMFKWNFAKYLINIYHVFNIILPKPCEIFGKFLANFFNKTWIQQLILWYIRQIQFCQIWQNEQVRGKLEWSITLCFEEVFTSQDIRSVHCNLEVKRYFQMFLDKSKLCKGPIALLLLDCHYIYK